MNSVRWRRILAPLLISLVLFIAACTPAQESRYSQVQKDTTQRGATSAIAKKAEQGAKFNKIFPDGIKGYEVVPAQEKKGFAEYKVNKDGKNVAMLSISDTTSIPSAAAKYQTATEKVAGYPAVDQGTNATGILVNDRYQVKILSRDPSFTKEDRVQWLQKFDLKALARMKPAIPEGIVSRIAPVAVQKPLTQVTKLPPLPQRAPNPTLVPQPAG